MKILFYGDLQINGRRPDYMTYLQRTLLHLCEVCEAEKPDVIVNLGDVMDTKNLVDVEDLVWGWRWMKHISSLVPQENPGHWSPKPRHWVLKGNHDLADKHGSVASVQVMEDDHTRICMEPELITHKGVKFLIIPYTEQTEQTYQWIEALPQTPDVIIGHVDWIGCRLTPAYVSTHGFQIDWFAKRFPGVPIFNGHYHHPMDYAPLTLVGSPLHKDFNDVIGPQARGFTIYDTDTKEIRRVGNPHTFYCLQLQYMTEEELEQGAVALRDEREDLRVKVFVPNRLLEDAKDLFSGFLWSAVVPLDSDVVSVQTSALTVQSSPAEVLARGIEAATEDYDRDLLEATGREVFRL
jgi:hypothetical protein